METLSQPELIEREPRATPSWPRITLVTAVRNGARYIEDTICSVISQGYPNLEYIVVDSASTDGTVDIIRKYEKHISRWCSEPDRGMYDGINKGFAHSKGELMGWLNASDLLQTNGLFVVGSVLRSFPKVEWITGRPTGLNSDGSTLQVAPQLSRWSRYAFLAGANKYIQQESTFWRRSLWDRAGGFVDASYRAEGDFDLWVRFFRHAQLYSVDAPIGLYRPHKDGLGSSDLDRYNRTCDGIIERELNSTGWGKPLKAFQRTSLLAKRVPILQALWYWTAIKGLHRMLSRNEPPIIEGSVGEWRMRR